MASRNLEPGQFQIGDLIMGPYTMFKIESMDIGNYDVNVQDSQAQDMSELRFGLDTLKPAPIQLTINVLVNKIHAGVAAITGDSRNLNFDNDPNLADLQREWRAEEIMQQWGAIKPLYFCGTDGITRMFFGRPGKFAYKHHRIVDSQYYQCQAEFRRSDTFAYSEQEYYVTFEKDTPKTVTLTSGNAASWVRFLLFGPMVEAEITFGPWTLKLHHNIGPNEAVEISSYPWSGRRVVSSLGYSYAAYLEMTPDPYLSKLTFPNNTPREVSWTALGTTSESGMSLLWHDAYQVMA
jgi:hypothetical protein